MRRCAIKEACKTTRFLKKPCLDSVRKDIFPFLAHDTSSDGHTPGAAGTIFDTI